MHTSNTDQNKSKLSDLDNKTVEILRELINPLVDVRTGLYLPDHKIKQTAEKFDKHYLQLILDVIDSVEKGNITNVKYKFVSELRKQFTELLNKEK